MKIATFIPVAGFCINGIVAPGPDESHSELLPGTPSSQPLPRAPSSQGNSQHELAKMVSFSTGRDQSQEVVQGLAASPRTRASIPH
jgi:hypothetical protein